MNKQILKKSITFILLVIVLLLIASLYWNGQVAAQKKSGKYLQGSYVDSLGHTVSGYLSIDNSNIQYFYFKKELNGSPCLMDVLHCQAFTIENHHFYRLSNITAKGMIMRHHFNYIFAELLEDGPVKLYSVVFVTSKLGVMKYVSFAVKMTTAQSAGFMMDQQHVCYFLKNDSDTTYLRLDKKKKHFVPAISSYLADDTTLVKKIAAGGDYSYANIESIIQEYNAYKRNK